MTSVFVSRLYFSGYFCLHPLHTQHLNVSSHFQSISRLPHSRQVFRVLGSSSTLSPGSKGPALSRRSDLSSCCF